MARVHAEPAERPAGDAVGGGIDRDEAVRQLAEALRTAERAHRAYQDELRLGDVEPDDDWPTWYAEFLLGQR